MSACQGTKYVWAETHMFLPRHDCDHTIITYQGTIVSGHKRLWAQSCLGTNVCGHNRVGSSMYGHNCVVSDPNIGSFRLTTHRRDAHRNFFDDPFLNRHQNFFAKRYHMNTLGGKGLIQKFALTW